MIILLTTYLLLLATSRPIGQPHPKLVEVEKGSAYTLEMPVLFNNYQYSSLQHFIKVDTQAPSDVCYVKVKQEGQLTVTDSLGYLSEDVGNKTEQWLQDRIVYNFEELKSLKTFQDAVYYDSHLFAIFNSHQGQIYSISSLDGSLTRKSSLQCKDIQLGQSYFLLVQEQLLIISKAAAAKVSKDGVCRPIIGFKGVSSDITDLKSTGNRVYIGLGNKGLALFTFQEENNSLNEIKRVNFSYKDGNDSVPFSTDELAVDSLENKLFILDYTEGLLELPLNGLEKDNSIMTSKARLLVSSCHNLIVLPFSIFVTCPELIEIERSSSRVKRILHNSFDPFRVQFLKQRLVLYGRKTYAVYDLFGKVMDEYDLKRNSDMSMVVGRYLVSFGNFGLISELITPQLQQFECFSKEDEDLGKYKGILQTQGICSEYNGKEKKIATSQICTIEYPVEVTIKDSFKLDLTIQVYLLAAWAIAFIIVMIGLGIDHCLKIKKYQTLYDEQYDEVADISKNTIIREQSKTKEVVLTQN